VTAKVVGSGVLLNEAAARRREVDILRRRCDSPETMIRSDAKIKFHIYVSGAFSKKPRIALSVGCLSQIQIT